MSAGSRTPAEIEAEIDETRAALGETLAALKHKFAPKQMMEESMDMIRHSLKEPAREVGGALARNPVPLALIGIGLGWLIYSATRRDNAGRGSAPASRPVSPGSGDTFGYDHPDEPAPESGGTDAASRTAARIGRLAQSVAEELSGSRADAADAAVARLRHGADGAIHDPADDAAPLGDTMRRFGGTAYEKAVDYVEEAGDVFRDAGDRVSEMVDRYPLAIGGLAALAGAVLALGLPPTAPEDRYMGRARDDLRDRALDSGRDALARAEDTASRATAAALEAARDEVKATADEVPV